MKRAATCHPDRPHNAKGLCSSCYEMQRIHRKNGTTPQWKQRRPDQPLLEYLYEHIGPPDANGCRPWLRAKSHGYGRFCTTRGGRKNYCVTRELWKLLRGPIPDGCHLLHKCDNPPCCNIDHLFLGTNKDNVEDCKRKGRWLIGERHHRAKLTAEIVREVRRLSDAGISRMEVAEQTGLKYSRVVDIALRRTWKHLP